MYFFFTFRELTIDIPKTIRNNSTLYIHTVVLPSSRFEKSLKSAIRTQDAVHVKGELTEYAHPKSQAYNLLSESNNKNKTKTLRVNHLKTKYIITMCIGDLDIPHQNIPVEIVKFLRVNDKGEFLPILYEHVLQNKLRDLEEINEAMETANITYSYNPISIGMFKFYIHMGLTFENFRNLGFTDKDIDEIKEVFADTSLHLLCATMFVASLHVSY